MVFMSSMVTSLPKTTRPTLAASSHQDLRPTMIDQIEQRTLVAAPLHDFAQGGHAVEDGAGLGPPRRRASRGGLGQPVAQRPRDRAALGMEREPARHNPLAGGLLEQERLEVLRGH